MLKTTVLVAATGSAVGQSWGSGSGWNAPQFGGSSSSVSSGRSSLGSWSSRTPSSSSWSSSWGYPSTTNSFSPPTTNSLSPSTTRYNFGTQKPSLYGQLYPSKVPTFTAPYVQPVAPVQFAPAPAPATTVVSSVASPGPVTESAWEIALREAGFAFSASGDPVWGASAVQVSPSVTIEPSLPVYDPNTISFTSPPSYPEEWSHNWNHKNTVTEQRIQPSSVPLSLAATASSSPWNQMYATLPVDQAAMSFKSLSKVPSNQNPLYEQLPANDNKLDKAELEARYGKQLSADGPPSLSSYTKKPLRGMTKQGPTIGAGGTFRETEPSIINLPRTGKPVISYDFHGVIQNCPGRNMRCNVMTKVVDQLKEDAKNSDIIITTAGVPEDNDEIVSYLRDEAKIWYLIKELYNSGSKWEVMAALNVVRHYDDQMDNLVRINSRVTGLGLVLVDPKTERMTLHMA